MSTPHPPHRHPGPLRPAQVRRAAAARLLRLLRAGLQRAHRAALADRIGAPPVPARRARALVPAHDLARRRRHRARPRAARWRASSGALLRHQPRRPRLPRRRRGSATSTPRSTAVLGGPLAASRRAPASRRASAAAAGSRPRELRAQRRRGAQRDQLRRAAHAPGRRSGHDLGQLVADGLIAASARGSTAYSLSAGGPVLAPDLSALVVTPACAHALGSRSLVLAPGATRERAGAGAGPGAAGAATARHPRPLVPGDDGGVHAVALARARATRIPERPFLRALQAKLGWQGSARQEFLARARAPVASATSRSSSAPKSSSAPGSTWSPAKPAPASRCSSRPSACWWASAPTPTWCARARAAAVGGGRVPARPASSRRGSRELLEFVGARVRRRDA